MFQAVLYYICYHNADRIGQKIFKNLLDIWLGGWENRDCLEPERNEIIGLPYDLPLTVSLKN